MVMFPQGPTNDAPKSRKAAKAKAPTMPLAQAVAMAANAPKAEPKTVTVTVEQLEELIAKRLEAAMAKAPAPVAKPKASGQSAQSQRNDWLAVNAFKKAGFGTVIPRQDVKSYSLWVQEGFKPKAGTKAVKVKNLRLFHSSQVEPITAKEKAEILANKAAYIQRKNAEKVTPLK